MLRRAQFHDATDQVEDGDDELLSGGQRTVPKVQEHQVMTEDMVLDQENVLRSLGTTAISAKIRARMQSSAVISDMQAFKAANASALLEDFVRWHSPRDFILTDSDPEKDLEAEHADGERKYQFVRCTVGSPDGYPIHQYQDGQDGDEADTAEPFQVAIWQFASATNADTFQADPTAYAPQFGGYCAYAASLGYLAPTMPEAWTLYDGKLYLNANLRARELWLQDVPGNIAKGEANWPGILG